MSRLVGATATLLVLAASCGCARRSTPGSVTIDAASEGGGKVAPRDAGVTAAPVLVSPSVFSVPIAALRVHQELVVAGLVAAEGVVRVMGLRDGQVAWTADALKGVAWIADAELKLEPASDGVALVWRGNLGGRVGATLVVLGPQGEPRGEALSIGASACTTTEGVAWLDARSRGPVEATRVRTRRWLDAEIHDVVSIPSERAATLSCGEHAIYVLGDGDDDLTATTFSAGEIPSEPGAVVLRDKDFGEDDEREHEAYTVGDDLGIVRVGDSGTIALREISHGHASPWRRLKHALSDEDDIVAVDGDADATIVVFTREANDPCSGPDVNAESVRALRIDRGTGEESSVLLAPAHCESAPGPFWIAQGGSDPVVAWTERRARSAPNMAPIDAMAFRVLSRDRHDPAGVGRIDLQADAVVDATCDDTGCFAGALLRPADSTGDRPGPIRGLRYPP
jgi:hypothetical protein